MKTTSLVQHTNAIQLCLLLLGTAVFVQSNLLYWYHFMEQYMMFRSTDAYLITRLSEPGGLTEYKAELLSLAFQYPYGASLVITSLLGMITLCFFAYLRSCRTKCAMGVAALPVMLTWCFPQESIALFVMLLVAVGGVALYSRINNASLRFVSGFFLLTATFFLFAPANILMALLMAVYELVANRQKSRLWTAPLAVAWSLLLPLIAMRTVYILPMREAFFSKHLAHPEHPFPSSLWLITLSFPLLTLLAFALREKQFIRNSIIRVCAPPLFIAAAAIAAVLFVKDPMEQAYRYDYHARMGEWQEIVDHARTHSVHDMDALIYLNLALSKTGRFATDLMLFPQKGEDGFVPHNPNSRLGLIEASEVAWQVGQVNAAQRFAFVGVLSAERGVQTRLMKRLVETYIVTGEYRAAEKYITLLEATPQYRAWATAQRPLLEPERAAATDWVAEKRAYLPVTDNPFDITMSMPSALAYLIDDHVDNRAALEYGMGYLLVYKELGTFMYYMELMKARDEAIPKLFQEAICLYYAAVKPDPDAFRSYNIDAAVQERFMRFMQSVRTLSPALLKAQFGDTYYYYAQFVQTPKQRQ